MQKIFLPLAYGAVLACLLASACGCGQAALAQNSVTLHKGQLQQAKWYNAPINVQITDDRPRVKDFRQPDEAPQDFVIPVGPVGSAAPNTVGGSGVKMVRKNLAPAGFGGQSNISTRKPYDSASLPPTRMGGRSPVDKPQTRQIGMPAGPARQMAVSGHPRPQAVEPAVYRTTYPSGGSSLISGGGGGSHTISKDVVGALRNLRSGK